MAGYELVRLDSEGRIPIPEGETVLGRGPLLGVSDKRVSRQHGVLENQNGQLRLKPVHLNPCFSLQGGTLGCSQPLERDCWHPLGHGETFSLMPGRFIYRVEALGGEPQTQRAAGGLEGEEGGPQDVRDSPTQTGRTTPPADSPECDAPSSREASPTQEASPIRHPSLKLQQYEKEQSGRGFLPQPKRVLPAWMMATAAQEGASRKQLVPAAKKTKRGRAERPTPGLSSEETTAGLSSEEVRAGLSSEEGRAGLSSEEGRAGLDSEEDQGDEVSSGSAQRRKRRRKMSSDANTPTEKALPPHHNNNSPGEREEYGRQPDDGAAESDVIPNQKSTSPGGAGSGNAPSGSTRPRCPYGVDCYRKNPLHFQDCCHPGDHDYKEEEEEPEEEVDRPECPYGTDCYRKNPLHLKEYSHSRRRAPTRRPAPPARGDQDENDEDSFIDDSSDEAYDDSDYLPTGSDDG